MNTAEPRVLETGWQRRVWRATWRECLARWQSLFALSVIPMVVAGWCVAQFFEAGAVVVGGSYLFGCAWFATQGIGGLRRQLPALLTVLAVIALCLLQIAAGLEFTDRRGGSGALAITMDGYATVNSMMVWLFAFLVAGHFLTFVCTVPWQMKVIPPRMWCGLLEPFAYAHYAATDSRWFPACALSGDATFKNQSLFFFAWIAFWIVTIFPLATPVLGVLARHIYVEIFYGPQRQHERAPERARSGVLTAAPIEGGT